MRQHPARHTIDSRTFPPGHRQGLMDRKNWLALALDGFGRGALDRISATADGKVMVWREYSPARDAHRKRLHVWLHFVFFPPQYSAGASPQQMQSPLEVRLTER